MPLTGIIQLPDGSRLNGAVRFYLSYSAARDTTNNNITVASRVQFPVQNGTLPSTAKIVPNDVLQPANTFYTVQYVNAFGGLVAQNNFIVQNGASFDLGSATPTPVTTSNLSFGNLTGLTEVSTQRLNNVRMCDQFAGSSAGEKIAKCIDDLPSTGGTADARGLEGAQTLSQTITISKPVKLIFPYGTATSTASPAILITSAGKFSDIGCGGESNQATFATTSNCILATTNATGDIIQTQASGTSVHDLTLVYSGSAGRTGGAGINCRAGASVKLDNLRIVSTWIGIAMTEGSCSGSVSRIWMDSEGAGSGGAWYAQMAFSGCTALNTPAGLDCGQAMAATITDLHFNEVILSVGSVMGSGAVVLMDGGTDSISFNKLEIIKDAACTNTDCGVLWKLQNSVGAVGGGFDPPRWITCFACEFEGAATNATNPDIYIQSAMGLRLIGTTDISGGTQGIYITAGSRTLEFTWDVEITASTFATAAQECIKVASPTGKTISGAGYAIGPLSIHHNNISGCSQSSSGGYNAIDIGADLTFFRIEANYFEPGFSFFTNFPKNYIQVEAGGSDNYYIGHNQFNPAHRASGDLVDGGTGANKTIAFNQSGNSGGATSSLAQFNGSYSSTGGYGPTSLPTGATVNIAGGGSSTHAASVAFSDGSGRSLDFGNVTGGAFHPTLQIWDTGILGLTTNTFANLNLLGTGQNGAVLYCTDCKGPTDGAYTAGSVAAGSGSGALVVRVNSTWRAY